MLQPQDPALVLLLFDLTNKPLKGPVCPYLHFWEHQKHLLSFQSVDVTQGFHKSVSANTDKGNDCVPSDVEAVHISSNLSQHW